MTADKVKDSTDNATHYLRRDYGSSTKAVLSVYAKAAELSWLHLSFNTTGGYSRAYFNLNDGVVGTEVNTPNARIESVGNGWYLCSITGNTLPDTNTKIDIMLANGDNGASYTGNGTNGLYLWGAQLTQTDYRMPYAHNASDTLSLVVPDNYTNTYSIGTRLSIALSSTQGKLSFKWTPMFSAGETTGDIGIITSNADIDGSLPWFDATNNLIKATDGTNIATVALSPVAGTEYSIDLYFGDKSGPKMQLAVDGVGGTAVDYDGAFPSGENINIGFGGGFQMIKDIIWRKLPLGWEGL